MKLPKPRIIGWTNPLLLLRYGELTKARGARLGPKPRQIWGLALSGGGIRSATFCLGVLQALSEHKLLRRFDYLSTVSGGGYIGGLLHAWLFNRRPRGRPGAHFQEKRKDLLEAVDALEFELAKEQAQPGTPPQNVDPTPPGVEQRSVPAGPQILHWLRQYSSYLVPKVNFASVDFLGSIAGAARNVLLMQLQFFLLLVGALASALWFAEHLQLSMLQYPHGWLLATLALAVVGEIAFAAIVLRTVPKGEQVSPWLRWLLYISLSIAIFLSGLPLAVVYATASTPWPWWLVVATCAAVYGAPWTLTAYFVEFEGGNLRRLLAAPLGGAAGGLLVWGFLKMVPDLDPSVSGVTITGAIFPDLAKMPLISSSRLILFIVAPFVMATSVFVAATVHQAVAGLDREGEVRAEFWFNVGGVQGALAILWAAVCFLAVILPWTLGYSTHRLVEWVHGAKADPVVERWLQVVRWGIVAVWTVLVGYGVVVARNADTGSGPARDWRSMAARVAPFAFVGGVIALVGYGLQEAIGRYSNIPIGHRDAFGFYAWTLVESVDLSGWFLPVVAALALLAWFGLGLCVDVNRFGLSGLYRNRLVRCFLGASTQGDRHTDGRTGFDVNDDIRLCELMHRPYPLIGTALNIVQQREGQLDWQQRKAASFVLSPLYCGYFPLDRPEDRPVGDKVVYPEPDATGRVIPPTLPSRSAYTWSLGEAMAVSGAAVNPNMGYHSAPMVGFLLAMFNVRLGWWTPNYAIEDRLRDAMPRWRRVLVTVRRVLMARLWWPPFATAPKANATEEQDSKKTTPPAPKGGSSVEAAKDNDPFWRRPLSWPRLRFWARKKADEKTEPPEPAPPEASEVPVIALAPEPASDTTRTSDAITDTPRVRAWWPPLILFSTPWAPWLRSVWNWITSRAPTTEADEWKTGFSGTYTLKELMGRTSSTTKFVHLSDGGHFENLGVYELVRRRCRFILCVDAGADPLVTFEDLGNAVRKCRVDFGVEIDIDTRSLRPTGKDPTHRSCAVGTIRYPTLPGQDVNSIPEDGLLLYIKPTLVGDEPPDVSHYAISHAAFPHQTTGDQFFDEPQFESYRKLGRHLGRSMLRPVALQAREIVDRGFGEDVESFLSALKEHWWPPSVEVEQSFSRLGDTYGDLVSEIQKREPLAFLCRQVYPEWKQIAPGAEETPPTLPTDAQSFREAFHFCQRVLQLMENAYIDLKLDHNSQHPDNRGWMNLFLRWTWSPMFRLVWFTCQSMFGKRFIRFCEHELKLDSVRTEFLADGPYGKAEFENVKDVAKSLNAIERQYLGDWFAGADRSADVCYVLKLKMSSATGSPERLSAETISYTIGVAVVRGTALRWLRLRDHLRGFGFGIRALTALLSQTKVVAVEPEDYRDRARSPLTSKLRRDAFRQFFERAKESVSHARREHHDEEPCPVWQADLF